MKRLIPTFAWLMSVLLIASIFTVAGLYTLTRSSGRVIQTWKQPDNIQYDAATYYLSVVESDLDWHGFPVYVSRRYFVYVGLESGSPTHGHVVDFTFYPTTENIQTYIQHSLVTWSPAGVTFQTVSGDQLFVPKQMFMGGR